MNQNFTLDIPHLFTYHPPSPAQQSKYQALRDQAGLLAAAIVDLCPDGSDKTDAVRKLRECLHMANAAIALNGRIYVQTDEDNPENQSREMAGAGRQTGGKH